MTAVEPRRFRTKTGFCTLEEDRLVLTREGVRGVVAEGVVGSSVARPLIIYGLLAVLLASLGARLVLQGQHLEGGLLWAALLLGRAVFRSRSLSATPQLALASIQRVEPVRPRPPFTRGYFVVHFTEGGVARRRLIMLPGVASGGTGEFDRACAVFGACGLLKGEAREAAISG
jgi:hypothetical protein